jgi:hypothetical protein
VIFSFKDFSKVKQRAPGLGPGPTSISEVIWIEPECGGLGKEIWRESTVTIVFVAALQQTTSRLWESGDKARSKSLGKAAARFL